MFIIMSSAARIVTRHCIQSLPLCSRNVLVKIKMPHSTSARMEFSSQCQFMVVGLGNHSMPATRHSIGMATVDRLCRHLKGTWNKDRECQGDVAIVTLDDHQQIILLKPRLFMNINGRSVIKTARKYQVHSSDVYLLHDDLDRDFGKHSIKNGGSAGGHNGVKSSICALGTVVMPRLRIGIGRPTIRNDVQDYVLSRFSVAEKEHLPHILDACIVTLLDHITKRTVKT